jgi:hypothetical protein
VARDKIRTDSDDELLTSRPTFLIGAGKYKDALTRKWWNWQTHHLEGVAPKGVGVQIPPSAPILSDVYSVGYRWLPSFVPLTSNASGGLTFSRRHLCSASTLVTTLLARSQIPITDVAIACRLA